MNIKPSMALATVSWSSLFILTWLILLNYVPLDALRVGAWLFFLVIAICSMAVASSGRRPKAGTN